MGLDTTHDCWHGGYGAFNRFREEIAKVLDIPLDLMDGYYDPKTLKGYIDQLPLGITEILTKRLVNHLPIYWDILKPDAIYILLHHSDCDGIIEIKDQIPIAQRLEEISDKLPVEPFDMREKAIKFATGLRLANSLNEVVEFH